jgi:hypothetical protein
VTVDNLPPMMLNSSAFDNYLRATVGLDVDDGKLAPGLRLHKLSSDAWVTVYKNLYTSHIYYQLHVADVSPLLQHRNTTDDNTYLCYVNSLAYAKVSNIQFTETDVQRVPLYETLQLKVGCRLLASTDTFVRWCTSGSKTPSASKSDGATSRRPRSYSRDLRAWASRTASSICASASTASCRIASVCCRYGACVVE